MVARRTASGAVLLWVISLLIFAGTEILPGDAAYAVLGRNAAPTALAAVRKQLGLDRPAYERYADWLAGASTATSVTRSRRPRPSRRSSAPASATR